MCGAPFDLKRSYTNLNVVDSFKKKNNKTIITLIIEHMCCCEEGEIVLEEIFSTAILVPLIAVGGKNLANHRKHFVFHPPQTNGEGGGTPTQPQVKGLQRNLKYKHFLSVGS